MMVLPGPLMLKVRTLEARRWLRWAPLFPRSPFPGAAVGHRSSSRKYSASFRSQNQMNTYALIFRRTRGA
eukprot:6102648-Alexandrium_andersonii.AAC.1